MVAKMATLSFRNRSVTSRIRRPCFIQSVVLTRSSAFAFSCMFCILLSFTAALHKPLGDVTDTSSVLYTVSEVHVRLYQEHFHSQIVLM